MGEGEESLAHIQASIRRILDNYDLDVGLSIPEAIRERSAYLFETLAFRLVGDRALDLTHLAVGPAQPCCTIKADRARSAPVWLDVPEVSGEARTLYRYFVRLRIVEIILVNGYGNVEDHLLNGRAGAAGQPDVFPIDAVPMREAETCVEFDLGFNLDNNGQDIGVG